MVFREKRKSLALISECILVNLVLKLLAFPYALLLSLFSVIFLLKLKTNWEVLNYHPHSAAKTMKKGRNVSNDP